MKANSESGGSRTDTHEPGWHSLVAAICLTALQDYWTWFRNGAIKDVRITDYDHDKHHRCDVADLLKFIHDGSFSRVMEMAGVDCTTEDLLKQIKRMERDGSHTVMFGSGRGRSIKRRLTTPSTSARLAQA